MLQARPPLDQGVTLPHALRRAGIRTANITITIAVATTTTTTTATTTFLGDINIGCKLTQDRLYVGQRTAVHSYYVQMNWYKDKSSQPQQTRTCKGRKNKSLAVSTLHIIGIGLFLVIGQHAAQSQVEQTSRQVGYLPNLFCICGMKALLEWLCTHTKAIITATCCNTCSPSSILCSHHISERQKARSISSSISSGAASPLISTCTHTSYTSNKHMATHNLDIQQVRIFQQLQLQLSSLALRPLVPLRNAS